MVSSTMRPLALEELRHPEARWLLAYWRTKEFAGALPSAGAIDAHETRAVAPHLMLLRPAGNAGELRYESVGAAVANRFGTDMTGAVLHTDPSGVGWASILGQGGALRRPAATGGRIVGSAADWAEFEAVALPLESRADDRVEISVLLGLFFFER